MPINTGSFQPYEDFLEQLKRTFAPKKFTMGGRTMRFDTELTPLEKGNVRVRIKQGDKNLSFTVARGPEIAPGKYAVLLPSVKKGSEHARIISPEIYWSRLHPNFREGDVVTRDDSFRTLRDYAFGTFFEDYGLSDRPKSTFNRLLSAGSHKLKLAGGIQTVSPHMSQSTLASMGRRTTVAYGPYVRSHEKQQILTDMERLIHTGHPPYKAGDFFRNLAGMIPYRDEDLRTRWRRVALGDVIQKGAKYVYDMLGGLGKEKGLNVYYSEKETLEESGMWRTSPSGILSHLVPELITEGREEGLRRLNIQVDTDKPLGAFVMRDLLGVAGTPDSGATTVYRENLWGNQNVYGPTYRGTDSRPLFPSSYTSMLKGTTFDWGIFHKEYLTEEYIDPETGETRDRARMDEAGNRMYQWTPEYDIVSEEYIDETGAVRTRQVKKKKGLEGYTIERGESAVIGLMTTQVGGKDVVRPIRYAAGTRRTTIADMPTLVLPPFYDPDNEVFSPFPGAYTDEEKRIINARRIEGDDIEQFRQNMRGGYISMLGEEGPMLSVPIATETGLSVKTMGLKTTFQPAFGIIDKLGFYPSVNVGGREFDISGITGEVKNPLAQFVYGTLGTMTVGKQRSLLSTIYGKDSAMMEHLAEVENIQNQLLEDIKEGRITRDEASRQWVGTSLNVLARKRSEEIGERISPWRLAEDIFTQSMTMAAANPAEMIEQYGFGVVGDPQYVKYKTIHGGYRDYLKARLKESVLAARNKPGSGISRAKAKKLMDTEGGEGLYKFTKVEGTKDQYLWEIMYQGMFMPIAGGVTTEFLDKAAPRLNPEEFAALRRTYPEVAETITAMQDRLTPPGLKAWRTLDQFVAFQEAGVQESGKPVRPGEEGTDYTDISREQADEMLQRISELPQEEQNFEGFSSVVRDVMGGPVAPLLRMQYTGVSVPSPSVVKEAAYYEQGESGLMMPISAESYSYPQAFRDILGGGGYGTGAAKRFLTSIADTLYSGGDLIKSINSMQAPGGAGGHMALGGFLPPNHILISDVAMKQAIISMAKADKLNVFKRGKINEDYMASALKAVEEQGGLYGFLFKAPSYGRELMPAKFVSESIARKKYDLPSWVAPEAKVKGGRVFGSSGFLHGYIGAAGYGIEALFADWDADPGRWFPQQRLTVNQETGEAELYMAPNKAFMKRLGARGKAFTKTLNMLMERMIGDKKPGEFSATVSDMVDVVLGNVSGKIKGMDPKIERVGTEAGVKSGIENIVLKQEMGTSYNARRLMEAVSASTGTYGTEEIDDIYEAFAKSYTRHLEFQLPVPTRLTERYFSTLFPSNPAEGPSTMKTMPVGIIEGQPGEVESTPGVMGPRESMNFDATQYVTAFRRAASQDVKRGYLTPHAMLAYFSTGGEDYRSLKKRYNRGRGEDLSDIIDSIVKAKEFKFSETLAGRMTIAQSVDKLFGATVGAYTFPTTERYQQFAGMSALRVLSDEWVSFGENEYQVNELYDIPWINTALNAFQYEKRTRGPLNLVQRAVVEDYAQELESAGKDVPSLIASIRQSLNTRRAYDVLSGENIHLADKVPMQRLQQYKPSPHEFAALAYGHIKKPGGTGESEIPFNEQIRGNIIANAVYGFYAGRFDEGPRRFIEAGNIFEAQRKEEFEERLRLKDTYRPEHPFSTPNTIFGALTHKEDIMGVQRDTGKFYIGEMKWSASQASALAKMENPHLVKPQLLGYGEAFWAWAHPEEVHGERWEQVLKPRFETPLRYFQEQVMYQMAQMENKFVPTKESDTTAGIAPKESWWSQTELEEKRRMTEEWYHAIRERGITMGVVSGVGGLYTKGKDKQYSRITEEKGYKFFSGEDIGGKQYKIVYGLPEDTDIATKDDVETFRLVNPDVTAKEWDFNREEARDLSSMINLGLEGIQFKDVESWTRRFYENVRDIGKLGSVPKYAREQMENVYHGIVRARNRRLDPASLRRWKEEYQRQYPSLDTQQPGGAPFIPTGEGGDGGRRGGDGGNRRTRGGGTYTGGDGDGGDGDGEEPGGEDDQLNLLPWMRVVQWQKGLRTWGNYMAESMASVMEGILNPAAQEQKASMSYIEAIYSQQEKIGRYQAGVMAAERFAWREGPGSDYRLELSKRVIEELKAEGEEVPLEWEFKSFKHASGWYPRRKVTSGALKAGQMMKPEDALAMTPELINRLGEVAPGRLQNVKDIMWPRTTAALEELAKVKKGLQASKELDVDADDMSVRAMEKMAENPMIAQALLLQEMPKEDVEDFRKTEDVQKATIDYTKYLAERFKELGDNVGTLNDHVKTLTDTQDKLTKSQEAAWKATEERSKELATKGAGSAVARGKIEKALEQVTSTEGEISLEKRADIAAKIQPALISEIGLQKDIKAQAEQLGGIISGDKQFLPPNALGAGLRNIFGGWGMMYLSRIMGWGVGELSGGFEERIQYEQAGAAQAYQLGYGAPTYTPYQNILASQELASGGTAYGGIQVALGKLGIPSEVSAAAKMGFGTYLGAQFIGGGLAAAGTANAGAAGAGAATAIGGFLSAASIPLAIGTGLTIGAISINNMANDLDRTMARNMIAQAEGRGLSAFWTSMGLRAATPATGPTTNAMGTTIQTGGLPVGPTPLDISTLESAYVQRVLSGDMTVGEFANLSDETKKRVASALGMATEDEEFARVNYALRQQLALSLGQTQEGAENWNQSVREAIISAGIDIQNEGGATSAAQMALMLSGTNVPSETQITGLSGTIADRYQGQRMTRLQAGLELMTRTPNILNQYAGVETEKLLEEAEGIYADIAGGRYESAFMARGTIAEQAAVFGLDVGLKPQRYVNTVDWGDVQRDYEARQNLFLDTRNTLAGLLSATGQISATDAGAMAEMIGKSSFQLGTAGGIQAMQVANRALSWNPIDIGRMAMGFASMGMVNTADELSQYAITDFNLMGQQTGLGLWTTSLNQGSIGAVTNANMIWGAGNWEGTQLGQAMTYGINRDTGQVYGSQAAAQAAIQAGENVVGGSLGGQYLQHYNQAQYQRAQIGNQYAMLELRERYMPLFWDIEDRQRALQYQQQELGWEQQEWSFGFQREQMEMQNRQWYEGFGLQQKQARMQRQWTREDWGYQDLTRALQWGWAQEDYAENVRFMTGRERRIAERQMERETTMFNLETGQVDKQRERQEEMWALQDERFDLEEKHHNETLRMQEEALEKQEEFYERGKELQMEMRELQEESIELNRQYQLEQLELQKAALGAQAKYADEQIENNKLMLDFQASQDDVIANFQMAQNEGVALINIIGRGFEHLAGEIDDMFIAIMSGTDWKYSPYSPPSGGGGGGGSEPPVNMEQEGGDWSPLGTYMVGERGPELARPGIIGSVVNQYDIAQALSQEDKWSSRSVFYPTRRGGFGSEGTTIINVNIGDEKLASFILDTVRKDLEVV